jgi:predicted P-loop ATPase
MADQKITTNGAGETAKIEGNGDLGNGGGDLLSKVTIQEAGAAPPFAAGLAKSPRLGRKNMVALLTQIAADPGLRDHLRYNGFRNRIEILAPFPPVDFGEALGFAAAPDGAGWRDLGDAELREALAYFQGALRLNWANKGLVVDALAFTAARAPYHPVRQYFDTLPKTTDAEALERAEALFGDYFACRETPQNRRYLRRVGPCFLVSMVARVYEPGAKVDHMPVLVGDQGLLKSEGWRALMADPAWYSDDLALTLVDRDAKESLTGKLLVELAEMPHMRREIEIVKAFISRRVDRYRVAYGMMTQDYPRPCVFAGTTNDLEFVDVTGNRRFWPLVVTAPVRLDLIRRDRDKLFAAAVSLYRAGFEWWLPAEIESEAADVQADFLREDTWAPLIDRWIAGREDPTEPFSLEQVLCGKALGFTDPLHQSPAVIQRVSRILHALGYRRGEKETIAGERVRRWRLHKLS